MAETIDPATRARNEYNDIAADLESFLDGGRGDSLTDAQKDWLRRHAEHLDDAVTEWVTLLGGTP